MMTPTTSPNLIAGALEEALAGAHAALSTSSDEAGGVLAPLRNRAFARFQALGIPTVKSEAWKYTNIGQVLSRDFLPELSGTDVDPSQKPSVTDIPGVEIRIPILNGVPDLAVLDSTGTLPGGVVVTDLDRASSDYPELLARFMDQHEALETDPFAALNTAVTRSGLFVWIPDGVHLTEPIHLASLVVGNGTLIQSRLVIGVGRDASAMLVATGTSVEGARTFTNSLTEVYADAGAAVDVYRLQAEGAETSQVSSTYVRQRESSRCTAFTLTIGGDVVRNNLSFLPDGQHCESHLLGLVLGRGRMHVDNHTLVDHAQPDCFSNELYKNILDDQATGVFNGKVFVRRDAQRTNAYQSSKSVLLSESATMNSKPELEIYADDVKCSHGATTGRLDDRAMFYLRSRGLTERQARSMLLVAFARDVLESLSHESLRQYFDELVTAEIGK
jgi:Fe-S cluster assembly protein SufD